MRKIKKLDMLRNSEGDLDIDHLRAISELKRKTIKIKRPK